VRAIAVSPDVLTNIVSLKPMDGKWRNDKPFGYVVGILEHEPTRWSEGREGARALARRSRSNAPAARCEDERLADPINTLVLSLVKSYLLLSLVKSYPLLSHKIVPLIGARRQGSYAKLSFWPVLWVKTCSYLIKLTAKGILAAQRWFFPINETQFGRFQAQTGTIL
jgi:hypothetical protein